MAHEQLEGCIVRILAHDLEDLSGAEFVGSVHDCSPAHTLLIDGEDIGQIITEWFCFFAVVKPSQGRIALHVYVGQFLLGPDFGSDS